MARTPNQGDWRPQTAFGAMATLVAVVWLGGCDGVETTSATPTSDPVPDSCPGHHNDVGIKHEVSGENGTFTDHCDAVGNLVDHRCHAENTLDCSNGTCTEHWTETATVMEFPVDCGGYCLDGMCTSVCPESGSIAHYQTINMDGTATVRLVDDGTILHCERTQGPFTSQAELDQILQLLGWNCVLELTAPPQGLCLPNSPGIMHFLGGPDYPAPAWGCVVD